MESLVKSVLGNRIDGAKIVEVIQIQATENGDELVRFYHKDGRFIGEVRPRMKERSE
jgi:hypothetical protein